MASARFSQEVLRRFYGLIRQEENRNLHEAPEAKPTILESIENLPPEIREIFSMSISP